MKARTGNNRLSNWKRVSIYKCETAIKAQTGNNRLSNCPSINGRLRLKLKLETIDYRIEREYRKAPPYWSVESAVSVVKFKKLKSIDYEGAWWRALRPLVLS